MRDLMIKKLEELQQTDHITRLYFTYNGNRDFVEDFTPFANEKYMSNELLDALAKGKTLTCTQKRELDTYVIEQELVLN